jgi:hypothetical protein
MVDGRRLLDFINDKHTRMLRHAISGSSGPLLDADDRIWSLIVKYAESFGTASHNRDLTYATYEDYLKDARYPISRNDFKALESI